MYYTYTYYADNSQMVGKSMSSDDKDEIDWGEPEDAQPNKDDQSALHRAHVAQRQAISQAKLEKMYEFLGLNALKISIDELKEGPEYKVLQTLHNKVTASVNVYLDNKNEGTKETFCRSIKTAINEAKVDPALESTGKNILNFFIKLINKVLPKDNEISLLQTESKKQVTDFSKKCKEVRDELKKITAPPLDSPSEQNGPKSS